MAIDLESFIDAEEPEISKDINTLGSDTPLAKADVSILDVMDKNLKVEKKQTPVYLDEITLMKLKTVAYDNDLSVANLLETTIKNLTKDIVPNKKIASLYDKKIKGNRGKKSVSK